MTQNNELMHKPEQELSPSIFNMLREQAQLLIKTGFLPKAIDTPEKAIAIILTGRELGIPTMTALRTIDVINQKPTVSPQLMLGLINASKELENIEIIETRDNQAVSCTMKRKGKIAHTEIFGFEEANKLGLLQKDNYKRQPITMFRWRAVAACARVVFPDVVLGIYTGDEMGKEIEFNQDGEIIETAPLAPLAAVPPNNVTPISKAIVNPEITKLRDEISQICHDLNYPAETKNTILAKFDSFKTVEERTNAFNKMKAKLADYQKQFSTEKVKETPKTLCEFARDQDAKPKLSPRELKALQIFEALKDGDGQVKLTTNGDSFTLFAPNDKDEWQDFAIQPIDGKAVCDCSAFKSLSKQKPEFKCEHINGVNNFLEYKAALVGSERND